MTRIATMAAALAIVMLACGGGGGGGGGNGPAGVDRSKPISSVTEADKGALCDWFVPMVGGYGAPPPCAMGFLSAPPDKATCIMEFPSCAVSIGDFEDCVVAVVAAQNVCTADALAAAAARPECTSSGQGNCFGGP